MTASDSDPARAGDPAHAPGSRPAQASGRPSGRTPDRARRLSKSRFVAGWRCPTLLWLRVHEPDAPELVPSPALQDRFEQGHEVGRRAQAEFPGGVLVPFDPRRLREAIAATRRAMAGGAPTIYEASFSEDGVFVAVDVLVREGGAWRLVEVKASNDVKDEHIPDVAVQLHVLRRAGLRVPRATLLHLNRDYRLGGTEPLFVHADVTEQAEAMLPAVPGMIREQLDLLAGPMPEPPLGARCTQGGDCPFLERCWPTDPDHVRRLHGVGVGDAAKLMARGIHRFADVPADLRLRETARRQLEAWRRGGAIVEPGLAGALAELRGLHLGFLDFETVSRAIPVWPEAAPWDPVPVQWSYHERAPDGTLTHRAWLAEGPADPRPELARALVEATAGADRVLTYTGFEKRCITHLRRAVPELDAPLAALAERLVDLRPLVANHVAHPDFGGSFSIKAVVGPLTGNAAYEGLDVAAGDAAAAELARLLLRGDEIPPGERDALRRKLLDYCAADTRAMVGVFEALLALGGRAPGIGPEAV